MRTILSPGLLVHLLRVRRAGGITCRQASGITVRRRLAAVVSLPGSNGEIIVAKELHFHSQ
jgi:hypothetical protein